MHSDHAKKSKDISKTSDKALSGFSFKRELKILAFGLVGSLIMAVNIKSFVHTGGLYPGGFTPDTDYMSALLRNSAAVLADQPDPQCHTCDIQL